MANSTDDFRGRKRSRGLEADGTDRVEYRSGYRRDLATVFSMMLLMALTTTFMTSPLLALVYPKQKWAQETDSGADVSLAA